MSSFLLKPPPPVLGLAIEVVVVGEVNAIWPVFYLELGVIGEPPVVFVTGVSQLLLRVFLVVRRT